MDQRTRPRAHPAMQAMEFAPLTVEGAAQFDAVISRALGEDIGLGDVTTDGIVDPDAFASGDMMLREAGTIAGVPIAARVFKLVDERIEARQLVADGTSCDPGTRLLELRGPARGILTAERVALNFLGRLSGIATLTRRYVDGVRRPYATCIADTRKTTPGLRAIERYAVRAGGGVNHRFNLSSAILIKDNHIAVAGSVTEAVARVRRRFDERYPIEVECESLEQVRAAILARAEIVLLDNMNDEAIRDAVSIVAGRAIIEASGSMTPERVGPLSALGVDVISVGAITHGARALDVGLDFTHGTRDEHERYER